MSYPEHKIGVSVVTPHVWDDADVGLPRPWYGLVVMFLRVRATLPLPLEWEPLACSAAVSSGLRVRERLVT